MVPIPLLVLAQNPMYQPHFRKLSSLTRIFSQNDTLNINEDHHNVEFGPHVEEQDDDNPPFNITLNFHAKLLHNYMLDLGSSHNIMPKLVMINLGLDITKHYYDLYSFKSRKV